MITHNLPPYVRQCCYRSFLFSLYPQKKRKIRERAVQKVAVVVLSHLIITEKNDANQCHQLLFLYDNKIYLPFYEVNS